MKSFTKARFLLCERKILRASKLIAEARAVIVECSVGDYMVSDERRIMVLRDVSASLDASLTRNRNAIVDMSGVVKGGII